MSVRRCLLGLTVAAAAAGAFSPSAQATAQAPEITDIWPSGRRPSSLPPTQPVSNRTVPFRDLRTVCPDLPGGCEVQSTLVVRDDGRTITLGSTSFAFDAGTRVKPRVRITADGWRLLRDRGEMIAVVSVTVRANATGECSAWEYRVRLILRQG